MASSAISGDELLAARCLAIDAATAEIVRSIDERGSSVLLLKGPAIARWLYDAGEVRSYVDTDLFVRLQDLQTTREVLLDLGYIEGVLYRDPLENRVWARERDRSAVDLHVSLWGVGVDLERQWTVLTASAEEMNVGGSKVSIPRATVRACLLPLHVAKHGHGRGKPVEDLRRGIDRLSPADWEDALEVAIELDAVEAFSAGLRSLPTGAALASHLKLPPPRSKELLLRADTERDDLLGMDAFLASRGLGAKMRFVADRLIPTPAFMRAWYALARRGKWGLAAAYLLRPFDLIRRMIKTLLRRRRAGRRSIR